MSGENTDLSWDEINSIDSTDRSLITDISQTLSNLSGKRRAERRRQKLRDELVREHIENRRRKPTFAQSLAFWFTK